MESQTDCAIRTAGKKLSDDERRILFRLMKGDTDACQLVEDVLALAHFWDDCIDRDVLISDQQINEMLWKALFSIEENPFRQRHAIRLRTVMKSAVRSWMTATQWEREPGVCLEKKVTAYAIRSDYLKVITECAAIVGGDSYAMTIEPDLRELFHVESVHDYLKGLREEVEQREAGNVR